MRKAIFIFIAIILVAVGIDWLDSCAEAKTDTELFERNLTYADMYEYKDSAYDFVIRYPSFFTEQPNDNGHARFAYSDQWATVVLEGYVMSRQGQTVKIAMDSLAQALHATDSRQGEDFFILSGPQYESGSRIDGYSYYSKFVRNGKLWFVYTMVYPDRYHDVLTRLFNEIDDWQIWERPHLQLKQGESQTPKAVSE
ncbi:MAG: hypothetical protein J6E43_07430 [Prevotella sp.]|nr:hypothetical protein [Prevotella sp.]